MIFLFFALSFLALAQAGELGVRLEGPEEAGSLWLSHTWEWSGWSLSAHGEGALFPLGFRRANLKLSWNQENFGCAPELTILGTGRVDLLLSGSLKGSATWAETVVVGQVGFKGGWIGINFGPAQILSAWGLLRLERAGWFGELALDGPSPWQTSLKFGNDEVTVALWPETSLTFSQESSGLSVTSGVQILPGPRQFLTVRWGQETKDFRVYLASSGQVWFRAQEEGESESVSALFSINQGKLQATFEIRFVF